MILLLAAAALLASPAAPGEDHAAAIHRRIADPNGGPIVVAHRGCHAAAPDHSLPSVPENSTAALDHCVAIGVDVMETDVRRAKDGTLVMIHDATLDRTTTGTGPVADRTIDELKMLRLRADLGGPDAPATDERIMTLDEMLTHADRRIVLNLDIKDAIYPEVIDAVLRAHARDRVIVKTTASIATVPLSAIPPYDRVPFMPVLRYPVAQDQLADVMRTQLRARKRPLGFELPTLTSAILPTLASIAREAHVRLWINTLGNGYVTDLGGDAQATADPARVWGRLQQLGISMIQTDAPEALIRLQRGK